MNIYDLGDNNYLDSKAVFKNIAIAYYNSNKAINTEWYSPNFDNATITGDKLIFKNGKIYIGKNVKKVKLSATAFLENIGSNNISYIWLFVQKNNTRLCGSIASGVAVYFQSVVISDYIIDVEEGDYLVLTYNNPNHSTWKQCNIRSGVDNSRLYVEVIN